jgi:hypothetical protein
MRMDRTLKFGILALVAVFALVAIASGVSADPADTNSAPTEDWIFDEGKNTTIRNKVWTLQYNITVMNGSVLKLDGCTFTINGTSAWDPVYIFSDFNSTLELTSSKFLAEEGSSGFYVEAHDNMTITDCEFTGLVENPGGNAGITMIGTEFMKAQVDFVEVHDTWMCGAFFFENVGMVDMSNCEIYDIEGTGVIFYGDTTIFDTWYNLSIIDTNIYNCEEDGLGVYGVDHAGIFGVDVYNTDIWNISEDAIFMLLGGSGGDNGNGSLFASYDLMDIYDVGDMAIYMSTLYTKAGDGNMSNIFNATFTNMTITDIKNTGMYVQLVYSTVDYSLVIDNVVFTNISLDPTFQRIGAIWWWFQQSQGSTQMYVANTIFKNCNPSAFEVWDYGGNDFHFYECEFTGMTQTAAQLSVRSSASQSPTMFENCSFHDADASGINSYLEYRANGIPVIVSNCTFYNLTYAAMQTDSTSYAGGQGFNISGSDIHDIDGMAVDVYGYYTEGGLTLHLRNSTVTRTGGVRIELGQDSYQAGAHMDVIIINSSVDWSSGTAVGVFGNSYYNPCRVFFQFINSTVTEALGDGIAIKTEISGTSSYYKPKWDASVTILNATITDVDGIGISMQSGSSTLPGDRDFKMNYTTVYGAQRGLFNVGFSGSVYYCDIQNTLKEDVFVIDARLDLWYCSFVNINERKFKAYDGGEILFHYDMDIFVRWDTGAAAIGATVQVLDNKDTLIAVLTVQKRDGSLPTFTMIPFFVRETGIFSDTPYVITATFLEVTKTVGVKLDANKEVYVILEDHFDPEIFILYPKEGHLQQSTTLQVRGSAWDSQSGIDQVLVTIDGENWEEATGDLRWNHTFVVNETLIGKFSGLFLLRAKAIDNALNEKVAFVMIRIDPTPPELNVDFPYDGYTTNNPELWVRGVTELGSTVEINSQPVELVVSMFTHKVMLVEGPNTISVISIDPLGNIQIERLTIYLDTQEPYIILTSPEEERAMTNEEVITIEATVEEDLHITVNGYHVPYGSDNYPEGAGILSYDVALEPGENVIVIQARDEADNLRIIDFVVVYDTTEPWIQVISPSNGAVLPRPEITVIGTIDPTSILKIQGETVTVTNGFFEIVILAFEGENTLTLEAEDAAGNVYEEDLTFTVDTRDPMLDITMPDEDDVTTNEVRYVIEGTTGFEDLGGSWVVSAGTVLVNGLDYTEVYDEDSGEILPVLIQVDDQGNFQIPVDLLEGRNEFTIEALDEVGNKASTTVTVRLDTVAPTLVMYIDPVFFDKQDDLVSHAFAVNITGYTDPGSYLTINDIPLPVSEDGEFTTGYDLSPDQTVITLVSIDSANNERTVIQTIIHKDVEDPEGTDEWDLGLIILLIAIVLLAVVIIGMFVYVRGRREDIVEMEAAEATPLAPMEETVLEEPDTLPGPDELDVEAEEEPAPTSAPARPRPRPPQARRAAPRPVPREGMPEVEDKDLSEKDAEADIGADETDQEGI